MAGRGDVMHYTLDLCKDRKARVFGIFGLRRTSLPCQRRRAVRGTLLTKNGSHTDITVAVLGSFTA